MPDQREIATRLIAIGVVQAELKAEETRLRQEFGKVSEIGDRSTAKLGDTPLGTVTMCEGSSTPLVADYDALLAWVLENHPEQIERKPSVRHSFVEVLKSHVKDFGGLVDEDGVVQPVPGIEIREGDPKPMVKASAGAKSAVLDAIRDGRYLAIEPRLDGMTRLERTVALLSRENAEAVRGA